MAFTIVSDKCEGLCDCRSVCPVECISWISDEKNAAGAPYSAIDPTRCTDCGACLSVCPVSGAILNEWRPDLQRTIPDPRPEGPSAEAAPLLWLAELELALALSSTEQLQDRLASADIEKALEVAPHLLHLAASVGETACCRVLLAFGYPIDFEDVAGETPLFSAITRQHPRQSTLLVAQQSERTRLGQATDTCNLLLWNGADPDRADSAGWTPLHHAASAGEQELVWLLLEWGARIDQRDARRRTPLHLAAERGAVAAVAALLAAGADPSARDETDTTPLSRALQGEFVSAAAALIFATGPHDVLANQLALHALAFAGDLDRLERAIAGGADLDAPDPSGRTALHWAALAGRTGPIVLLLDAGARPDILDATGASAADYGLSARLSERQREAFSNAFRFDRS